jgi:4-hydroxybutyrate CoA-transferase
MATGSARIRMLCAGEQGLVVEFGNVISPQVNPRVRRLAGKISQSKMEGVIELHPTEYVNDPFRIAQNERMVAINSAIEIDLTGQVCADSIGPRLYSGVGGQVDFIYGVSRSKGGKPIIGMPSTAEIKGEPVSKIVPMLKWGAGVVTTRNHVRFVVTEYGIADLYGKTIRQRGRAMIDVANPQFREGLEKAAYELKYL